MIDKADRAIGPFSLVMTAFAGKYWDFAHLVDETLGWEGLDTFSLAIGPQQSEAHLPVELVDGLDREAAEETKAVLEAVGATVEMVATADVIGVRYRAREVRPNRRANGWSFTEFEGMILTLSPLNARDNVRHIREWNPNNLPAWRIERSANHRHPTIEMTSRASLRIAREMGEDLATALRAAYPERGFVLSYLEEQVSFYQRGAGAPEQHIPPEDPLPEKAWCEQCQRNQLYVRRQEPDPEFPVSWWGDCAVCGGEVWVKGGEELIVVGPA